MSRIVHFRYEKATCRIVIWDDRTATLSNLYSVRRGLGHARGVLRQACDYADKYRLTLLLEVQRYGGDHLCPDNTGLKAIYAKFGFVDCGRNVMQRLPSHELHGP